MSAAGNKTATTAIVLVDSDGRLALRRGEAAKALGISDEAFSKYVAPVLPCVRLGAIRLYSVQALQEFLAKNAELPLEGL